MSDNPEKSNLQQLNVSVRAAASGDSAAWDVLWRGHHERLLRTVRLRLDPRLRARVDPSDVVQDAWVEARSRLERYVAEEQPIPFGLWLRFLTVQQLHITHRRHFTSGRDPDRERPVEWGVGPEASSDHLAAALAGRDTRPSEAAARGEMQRAVRGALDCLGPVDREVLALRHFEQLSNAECARILGLTESGATRRYLRALGRLKDILKSGAVTRKRGDREG
jgi:RNA polymerase sigma-70 factor (ECF subfamily)